MNKERIIKKVHFADENTNSHGGSNNLEITALDNNTSRSNYLLKGNPRIDVQQPAKIDGSIAASAEESFDSEDNQKKSVTSMTHFLKQNNNLKFNKHNTLITENRLNKKALSVITKVED